MKVSSSILDLVGNTPLIQVRDMKDVTGDNRILLKLEEFNVTGSVKVRIAKAMIEGAESRGELKKGSTIIEATSGNTGLAISAIGRGKGYRTIIVMPASMSEERKQLIKAYGAELVLTEGKAGMKGAIAKAEELKSEIPNSFIPSQFTNPDNPAAHYATTGPEIWKDTEGSVDVFIAGIGTGGTISGVAKYLKQKNPKIQIIGVEPEGSPILTEGKAGPHKIMGIGAGFVPDTLQRDLMDEVVQVSDEAAFAGARKLASSQQILSGISSGAAFSAALEIAQRPEMKDKTIVVLLPDGGERYLSTGLFAE